jgi:hypothetical protein
MLLKHGVSFIRYLKVGSVAVGGEHELDKMRGIIVAKYRPGLRKAAA